ncbi:MAG: hypothetical protein ACAI35_13140 [Candidatus Methylacidiphilales bacterium]|nr:hypothetical protein [Candidatus Methylacidiphilales bacterium]
MDIPSELRIKQPAFPDPLDLARDLANSLREQSKMDNNHPASSMPMEILKVAYPRETLAIVFNIWRIKSRMMDTVSKEAKEELTKEDVRKINRYLESIYDTFEQLGISVIDRTGEYFDYGLPEKVVTAKPQEGINKEIVIETLRPTITWGGNMFPGEVEIATPITKTDKGE